jgi:hypothetical protein
VNIPLVGPWRAQVTLRVALRGDKAYIHFLPELPEKPDGYPPGEKTLMQTRQIIPALPA